MFPADLNKKEEFGGPATYIFGAFNKLLVIYDVDEMWRNFIPLAG